MVILGGPWGKCEMTGAVYVHGAGTDNRSLRVYMLQAELCHGGLSLSAAAEATIEK